MRYWQGYFVECILYMVVFSKMGLPLNHPKLENFSIETIETYDFEDP